MILLRLFFEFFQAGLFAIGGGMATLPFLQRMGASTGWFTDAQLADMVAISESTPGPIGVNMATYVGYTTGQSTLGGFGGGVLGAVTATLGLITPSVIVILIIAILLRSFRDNRYVNAAFYGLRPASAALITNALISVLLIALFRVELFRETGLLIDLVSPKALILAAVLLFLTRWCKPTKKLHPIFFILFSAVIGVVFRFGA